MQISALFLTLMSVLITFLLWRWVQHLWQWRNFPGPSRLLSLPIIGHMPLLLAGGNPMNNLKDMCKKYGKMFRCDIGFKATVIISDYKVSIFIKIW